MAALTSSPVQHEEIVLAINSGSSSLKIGFFEKLGDKDEECLLYGVAENVGTEGTKITLHDHCTGSRAEHGSAVKSQSEALSELIEMSREYLPQAPVSVGHRIVHGGPHLLDHGLITTQLVATLQSATHFAPLHIPASIALIRQVQLLFSDIPQVACFDTAFHRKQPEVARRLPLPAEVDALGVCRYGFHGLSYESVVRRLGADLPERVIIAHLGSGSSLCALHWGRPIHTTMSFTPTSGIPMATRCGDIDPSVLLFLMRNEGMNADQLETLVNHQSGLFALSDGESDMRRLLQREAEGNQHAQLAIEAYVNGIRMTIGAYAALLGGLDLLIFTGGIGENSEEIRCRVCHRMHFVRLSDDSSCEHVRVLPTEEERQIARICRSLRQTAA